MLGVNQKKENILQTLDEEKLPKRKIITVKAKKSCKINFSS